MATGHPFYLAQRVHEDKWLKIVGVACLRLQPIRGATVSSRRAAYMREGDFDRWHIKSPRDHKFILLAFSENNTGCFVLTSSNTKPLGGLLKDASFCATLD